MKNVSDEKLNEIKNVETCEEMLDINDECLEYGFEDDISNYEWYSLDDDFYIVLF